MQNSQENTSFGVHGVVGLNFIERRLQHSYICELLRNFQEGLFCRTSATAVFAHSCLSRKERFSVQYFFFHGFRKAAWIKNKLLLYFIHKKLDVINLTYFSITCVHSALLVPWVFFSFLIQNISCPKHSFKEIFWFCSIYTYLHICWYWLNSLYLVLCLDLWARACSSVICIVITLFRSL